MRHGPWRERRRPPRPATITLQMRRRAQDKAQWADVLALLPQGTAKALVVSRQGIEFGNSPALELPLL